MKIQTKHVVGICIIIVYGAAKIYLAYFDNPKIDPVPDELATAVQLLGAVS